MSDTFRKEYKPLTDLQKEYIGSVKDAASELEEAINMAESECDVKDKRSLALAKTNLEQAVMWAVKALTA